MAVWWLGIDSFNIHIVRSQRAMGVPAQRAKNGKMPRSVVDATIFAAAATDELEAPLMQTESCALGDVEFLSQRQ
jgi:hypothetical protein